MHDAHSHDAPADSGGAGNTVKLVLFWAFVGIPLLWGVAQTIANATKMFQ